MIKDTEELSRLWNEVCIGDQRSYALIHQKLYGALYIYGKRIINDGDVINDLLQDLFIKLWLRKEVTGPIDNIKAYFFTVLRSLCFDYIKSKNAFEAKKSSMEFLEFQMSIEDLITQRETSLGQRKTIELALSRLPKRQREIMQLRFFESLNCSEIGVKTGIQYQSVVNHLYRAVQTLRELYASEDELRVA